MTDAPTWPGVTEYLYQAASLGCPNSGGTWMVPLGFRPTYSSRELTPMAGMSMETGSERGRDRPLLPGALLPEALLPGVETWPGVLAGAIVPAAAGEGWGACCCGRMARAIKIPPPMMSTAATTAPVRPRPVRRWR